MTVTVGTGRTGKVWKLPKELLTHVSQYVNNTLNGVSNIAATSSLVLQNENSEVFPLFVLWLNALVTNDYNRFPIAILGNLNATLCVRAWLLRADVRMSTLLRLFHGISTAGIFSPFGSRRGHETQ